MGLVSKSPMLDKNLFYFLNKFGAELIKIQGPSQLNALPSLCQPISNSGRITIWIVGVILEWSIASLL